MEKSSLVSEFLKKDYLVCPDIFEFINENPSKFIDFLDQKFKEREKPFVINKDILISLNFLNDLKFNWGEFDKSRVLLEKGRDLVSYFNCLKLINKKEDLDFGDNINKGNFSIKPNVKILKNYIKDEKKIEIQDFIGSFRVRYKNIRELLQNRPELFDVISINKIMNKKEKETVSIIGMISNKILTKNNNFIMEAEDLTGVIKVIIDKKNSELYNICKDIMLDEVIGVVGSFSKGVLFCKNLIYADIPMTKELKKCPDEVYAICTSDLHIGSKLFLKDEFLSFINWLNGSVGNEKQKEIAEKVKYLFFCGDSVAGIGVYPNQENQLVIKDIFEQYNELAELLSKIRKDIFIIMCPGNHDAVRLSEPQPILDKEFAKPVYELENVILVTNPGWINIHSSDTFSGFDFLLYHGFSFPYFATNIESIRKEGGTARGELIKKYLLQRRHLAPSYSSSLYLPDTKKDHLIIDILPDFFVTGHLHQISNLDYRNITLIGCGCWESLTEYQEKVGSKADPSKVTLINLKTREIKILNFSKEAM